jgi:non-ribosomal peptide synthase protein (TIGR01720 family)
LVKDARRQLLANGWAYFTSRYLNPNGKKAFETHDTTMEVTFNYHGQFQELESDDSLFDNIDLPGVSEQGPALPVSTLFNIEVSLDNQQAQYEFSFNRHIAHQDLIQQWIGRIGQSLRSICEELVSLSASPSRTLCDYELLALDYPALDDFQGRIVPLIESLNTPGSIEDVWPCTPTVDGILLSQARQPEMYNTSQLYEIKSRDSQPVTVEELRKAWQMVVARQPSLRSVFIGGLDNTSAFNQVILKNHDPEVVMLYSESKDAAMESLKRLPPVNYQQLRPPHRIALCQTPDNTIYCQVEMSHAITDGASSSILTQEWINAYAGTLDNTNLLATNNSLVRHLKATTNEEKMAFWKTKLTGVEPSHFPHLSGVTKSSSETSASVIVLEGAPFTQIKEFCTAHSVTPASLLQAAWAHTLASYARMDSVCFGYLSSGRDVPIPGIDNSIGAYANMMICRADLQQSHSGSGVSGPSFVRQIHDQSVEDISYQHSSLAEIQHELDLPPGRALFNSIVSFQKQDESEVDNTDRLLFESLGGLDPTEVSHILFRFRGGKPIC